MKKILLSLAAVAMAFGASATEWTISTIDMSKATKTTYEFEGKQKDMLTGTWTADDGTVFNYCMKQQSSSDNSTYIVQQKDHLRWYKNWELTITAPATISKIKQVKFFVTNTKYALEFVVNENNERVGTVTVNPNKTDVVWKYDAGVNPWIGSNISGQIRANKIVIADVTSSTEPENPDVPKPETVQYDNIAAWLQAADANKPAEFKNPVTVVYKNGINTYVQDATGSMLIYGTIPEYTPGQQIPGGFIGDYKDYYYTIELTLPKPTEANYNAYFATYKEGVAGTMPQPTAVEIDAIDGATMGNKYVKLSGVAISGINGSAFTITKGTSTIAGRNQFNIALAATEEGKTVDIIGFVNYYQAKGADAPSASIYPVEIIGQGAVTPSTNTKVANIAAFLAGKDTKVVYEFENPVTVVYQNGTNTYVQDATGSMLIYGTTPKYTNGQQIPAGFVGKYVDYFSTIELSIPNDDESKATYKAGIDGAAVAPADVTLAEINAKGAEWGNKYVKVSGVTISELNGKSFTITEENVTLPGYQKFADVPVANTEEGKTVDIVGVVSWYTNKGAEAPVAQLYPISINETTAISEINADANAPVEYFNLQGVRVANPEGGMFIMRQGNKVTKVIR